MNTQPSTTKKIEAPFPNYGVEVEAITIKGKKGVWSHGQYGWYPQGKWGIMEYPHDYIATWEYLPNAKVHPPLPASASAGTEVARINL